MRSKIYPVVRLRHMTNEIDRLHNDINAIREQVQTLRHAQENPDMGSPIAALFESLEFSLESLYVAEAELRQQQEALQEAQTRQDSEKQRYFDLFEFAPDAYLVTSPWGTILEANRAASLLFNVKQQYLVGKPLTLYISHTLRRDFRSFLTTLSHQDATKVVTQELLLQSRHVDIPVPVSVTVLPILDENRKLTSIRWILRDITRRRLAETQLQDTNQLLSSLIAASPLGIVALDRNANVTLWNPAAEQITGWQTADVLGAPLPIIPLKATADYEGRVKRIFQGESFAQFEVEREHQDGTVLPIRVSAAPLLDNKGTPVGILGLFLDMREELAIREQLRHSKAQLREARTEEQRRLARALHDNAVQQLVGLQFQLAHFRRLAVSEAVAHPTFAPLSDGLESVELEMKGVIQLLRGVISDLRPPGLEEYGLCRALEGYVARVNRERAPDMLETEVGCPELDPPISLALSTILFRIAQEALQNVYRHAAATQVRITLSYTDSDLTLTVRDDGRGFTVPDSLATLALEEHFGLVGIAEMVEVANGKLTITSAPGEGTTVTTHVPLERKGTAGAR